MTLILNQCHFFVCINIIMPTWITSSGYIANLNLGETAVVNLNCNASNLATYEIIAGTLPQGLVLSVPNQNEMIPSIWGVPNSNVAPGSYSFTIRADDNNAIADRTFSIGISNIELLNIFPNSNLGMVYAGSWFSSNIAPIVDLSFTPNISILNNALPGNLDITSNGIISGFINPSILYDTPAIYPNIEVGKPNISLSAESKVFSFTANYGSNITANFSLLVLSTYIPGQLINAKYVTPTGNINGINEVFTLPDIPTNLKLYLNGQLLTNLLDYNITGNVIIYSFAPITNSDLLAFYSD